MSEDTKQLEEVAQLTDQEVISAEQVVLENKVLEEQKVDPLTAASTMFGMHFPQFAKAVAKLSSKSVRRVFTAVIGYPLEEVKLNLKNPDEMAAFYIAEELIKAKTILFVDAMYKQQQEAQRQAEEAKVRENVETATNTNN